MNLRRPKLLSRAAARSYRDSNSTSSPFLVPSLLQERMRSALTPSEGVRPVSEIAAGSELQRIEDLSESILQGIADVKDMLEQILPSSEPDERRPERRVRDSESATTPATWIFRIESSIVAIVLVGAVLGVIVNLFYIGLIIGWLWAHYDWAGWDV
ncbi:hypothetical protein BDV09DRAFT_190875 [Aspergillus tetrazonus]